VQTILHHSTLEVSVNSSQSFILGDDFILSERLTTNTLYFHYWAHLSVRIRGGGNLDYSILDFGQLLCNLIGK